MQIKVTNHAIIRYYERFINSGNMNGDQIAEEIKLEFDEAKFDTNTQDGKEIYKGKNIYFIVNTDIENKEKIIITIYPIKDEIEIKKIKVSSEDNLIKSFEESADMKIYKQVLDGRLKSFPRRFWEDDKGGNLQISARDCTKYMYEELLKWNVSDIINKSNNDIFKQYKLNSMVKILFNSSWHMAIYNAYPNIKPYEIKSRGNIEEYWKVNGIERAKEMGVWLKKDLAKDGYRFSGKGVLSLKWPKIIKQYKLTSMLTIVFNNNLVDFFNIVFDAGVDDIDIIKYEINLEKVKDVKRFG